MLCWLSLAQLSPLLSNLRPIVFADIVSANKKLFADTISANKNIFADTNYTNLRHMWCIFLRKSRIQGLCDKVNVRFILNISLMNYCSKYAISIFIWNGYFQETTTITNDKSMLSIYISGRVVLKNYPTYFGSYAWRTFYLRNR